MGYFLRGSFLVCQDLALAVGQSLLLPLSYVIIERKFSRRCKGPISLYCSDSTNTSEVVWYVFLFFRQKKEKKKKKPCLCGGKLIETPVSNNPYFGAMSDPWHMSEPQLCQKQLCSVRVLSTSLGSSSHGVGLSHSVKAILRCGPETVMRS